MTDRKHTDADGTGDAGKLPPRAADWHSGLRHDHPESFKAVAKTDPTEEARPNPAVTAPEPVATREKEVDFDRRETHLTEVFIAMLLAVVAFLAVAFTYKGIGHSWDEALYLKPSERAAAWMVGVFNSGDDSMMQSPAIDRHWGIRLDGHDPLHPEVAPVPKLLNGAGLTYLTEIGIEPMVAMRLPAAILFGLTVALIFLLGCKEYGRAGGLAAAVFYACMPRVFGHAHIAASETPLAFFTLLTGWCFLVGNRFRAFALFTGVAFGLAVATKVSALMLPVPLMLWGQLYRRRDYASNVFAMAFIAPLIVLAVWPWIWYDGLRRFFEYILFYVNHQKTAVFYQNRIWGYVHGPSAPVYYPLHIAAVSIPVGILVFLAIGLVKALFSTVRRPATVLFVLMAACWFGLSMLPNSPRYDGERLFFPAFGFLALLAGGGFACLTGMMTRWREKRGALRPYRAVNGAAAVFLVAALGLGAWNIYRTHPNELNHFNAIVGGTPGAYDQGFETAYWGEAVNEDVIAYLNETLQPGDKVKTLALNELVFDNLRQWGKLPDKVDFSPDAPPYDYVIMQIRQGFMAGTERRLFRSQRITPLIVFAEQGVPRLEVYAGADVATLFPPAADDQTTATEAGTPEPLALTDLPSTGGIALETLLTTGTIAAQVDAISTATQTTAGPVFTTSVVVLDLPTSTTETTSTEARLSSITVEMQPLAPRKGTETSATRLYEGTLPTTDTLLIDTAEQH